MKNFTISLLLFISVNCFAQIPNAEIDSIRPNVICYNETVKFYAHFTGTWGATNNAPIKDSLSSFNKNITYQHG
jgi:hypothetical protein